MPIYAGKKGILFVDTEGHVNSLDFDMFDELKQAIEQVERLNKVKSSKDVDLLLCEAMDSGWYSVEYLSRKINEDRDTVQKALDRLIKLGVVTFDGEHYVKTEGE